MGRQGNAYLVTDLKNPENNRILFGLKECAEFTGSSMSLVQKVASTNPKNAYFKSAHGYSIEALGEWE